MVLRSRSRAVLSTTVVLSALVLALLTGPASASDSPPGSPNDAVAGRQDAVVLTAAAAPGSSPHQRREIAQSVAAVAEQHGGTRRTGVESGRVVAVSVPAQRAGATRARLSALEHVQDVTESHRYSLTGRTTTVPTAGRAGSSRPNDPRFVAQRPYLQTIRLPQAWRWTRGSRSVRVAVVDTGVAVNHPDLRGKVVARYDAVHGDRSVPDRIGHGTTVASIAAAKTNNRRGLAGAGWRSSLMAVKVDDDKQVIWGDALARGIRWATNNGADVINLSLGTPSSEPLVRRAVRYAVRRGVLLVAAAGNQGDRRRRFPAAYPGVVAVGATTAQSVARFSNRGAWVDVGAPGVHLVAARPGGYVRATGTSFAAPIVAGQAALMLAARPEAGIDRARRLIVRTSHGVGRHAFSGARVDARGAVLRLVGAPTRPRHLRVHSRGRQVAIRWAPPRRSPRSPVLHYRVRLRPPNGQWRVLRVPGTKRQVTTRVGLARGTQVRVGAVNAGGRGLATAARAR